MSAYGMIGMSCIIHEYVHYVRIISLSYPPGISRSASIRPLFSGMLLRFVTPTSLIVIAPRVVASSFAAAEEKEPRQLQQHSGWQQQW